MQLKTQRGFVRLEVRPFIVQKELRFCTSVRSRHIALESSLGAQFCLWPVSHVDTGVPSLASDLPALTELVLICSEILRRKWRP